MNTTTSTSNITVHSNIITFSAKSKKQIFLDEYALSTSYVVEVTEQSIKLDPSRRFKSITSKRELKEALKTLDEQSIERVILENYDIPMEVAKCILTPYMCNLTQDEIEHITPISERFFGNPNYFKVEQN